MLGHRANFVQSEKVSKHSIIVHTPLAHLLQAVDYLNLCWVIELHLSHWYFRQILAGYIDFPPPRQTQDEVFFPH